MRPRASPAKVRSGFAPGDAERQKRERFIEIETAPTIDVMPKRVSFTGFGKADRVSVGFPRRFGLWRGPGSGTAPRVAFDMSGGATNRPI